jgi:hypothetical protein
LEPESELPESHEPELLPPKSQLPELLPLESQLPELLPLEPQLPELLLPESQLPELLPPEFQFHTPPPGLLLPEPLPRMLTDPRQQDMMIRRVPAINHGTALRTRITASSLHFLSIRKKSHLVASQM